MKFRRAKIARRLLTVQPGSAALEFPPLFLGFKPALPRGRRRDRRAARLGRDKASLEERLKSVHDVLSIPGLRSIAVSSEDKYSARGHAFTTLPNEPRLGLQVQRECSSNVKPKLHCRGNLVDILAPWSGRTNQVHDQLSAALL